MTYWKYWNKIVGFIVLFLISLVFASHTMMQTLLGATSLAWFLFFLAREIHFNNQQMKRTKWQVHLSHGLIVFGLLFFNVSVHQTVISTFGQTNFLRFLSEHEAAIRMNGKPYHLIWTEASWLSTMYSYNLYERRGLFYYRVNADVINYVTHPYREPDYGAVTTFIQRAKEFN